MREITSKFVIGYSLGFAVRHLVEIKLRMLKRGCWQIVGGRQVVFIKEYNSDRFNGGPCWTFGLVGKSNKILTRTKREFYSRRATLEYLIERGAS